MHLDLQMLSLSVLAQPESHLCYGQVDPSHLGTAESELVSLAPPVYGRQCS